MKTTNLEPIKNQLLGLMLVGPISLSRALYCTAGRFQPLDIIDAGASLVAEGRAARIYCTTEHTWTLG